MLELGARHLRTPLPSTIPFAETSVMCLSPVDVAAIRRAVALLHRTAHSPAYAARVDAGAAPVARHRAGNTGVFMGYDFHLTPEGPRLIEVNTNAGGGLLNGLHSWERCDEVCGRPPGELRRIGSRTVDMFRAELRAAAGDGRELRRVAIVDQDPTSQFLYPEFELLRDLLADEGVETLIVDTEQLDPAAVDLVYWRDTDFQLAAPRSRALRHAYLGGMVVVTPSPREHHLLANKQRLTLFSSESDLLSLGVEPAEAAFLARLVPETVPVTAGNAAALWHERKQWVFKPEAGHAGRAVYRGDKLTRKTWERIGRETGYLAQRRVLPGTLEADLAGTRRPLKFDVRAYAYGPDVLWFGARAYDGQITNLRTPGGGFVAVCDDASARAGSPEACAQ